MSVYSAPIIIIDQNSGISRAIGQMLRPIGYTNVVYDDGTRAVDKLAADLFSLIILEWRSNSDQSNDYLAEIFCCDTQLSKIPRIMLSSDASREAAEAAKTAGAKGYLLKPVSTEALQRQVLKVLGPANAIPIAPAIGSQTNADDKRRHIRFLQPKLEMIINDHLYHTLNWSLGGMAISTAGTFEQSETGATLRTKLRIEADSIVYEDQVEMVRLASDKDILFLRFKAESRIPMAMLQRIIREKSASLPLVTDSQ